MKKSIGSKLANIARTARSSSMRRVKPPKSRLKMNQINVKGRRIKFDATPSGKMPRPAISTMATDARGKYTYIMPISKLKSPMGSGIYK